MNKVSVFFYAVILSLGCGLLVAGVTLSPAPVPPPLPVVGITPQGSTISTPAPAATTLAPVPSAVETAAANVLATIALTEANKTDKPLFNQQGESKVSHFRMFFSLINSATSVDTIKKAIEDFKRLIVDVVAKSASITSQQIEEVHTLLTTIIAQVGVVDTAADKPLAKMLSSSLVMLKSRNDKVAAGIKEIARVVAIEDTKVDEKIAAFGGLLTRVDGDMLDVQRQEIIKALETFSLVVKKASAKSLDSLKKLLPMVLLNNSFTAAEKTALSLAISGESTGPAGALDKKSDAGVTASVSVEAVFKYIDVDADKKPVPIYRKCQIASDNLSLITASSSSKDKNLFITLANSLFLSYPTMNAAELGGLKAYLQKLKTNTFIVVSPQQVALLEQWIKSLDKVLVLAEADKPFLTTLKNYKTVATLADDKRLQLMSLILIFLTEEKGLLVYKLSPDGKGSEKERSALIALFAELLKKAYEKRSFNNPALITQLANVMGAADKISLLKPALKAEWVENVAFLNKLLAARDNKDVLVTLQKLSDLLKGLSKNTDDYSKNLLFDVVTNLYETREKRAQIEIAALQGVLMAMQAPDKKILFQDRINKSIALWVKRLPVLNDLALAKTKTSSNDVLTILGSMQDALTDSTMDRERRMFMETLEGLFAMRCLLTGDELSRLSSFFKSMQGKLTFFNLFNSGQQARIGMSIKELDELGALFKAAPSGAVLIDRLLLQEKNPVMLRRALDFMTNNEIATPARKDGLVKALNTCVSNIASLDRAAVLSLLQAVSAKKVAGKSLLVESQLKAVHGAIAGLRGPV
jgi:hypothetical protein